MLLRTMLIPVAAALLLTACGSSTSASKANFAKAINAALAKECIAINPAGDMNPFVNGSQYPVGVHEATALGSTPADADRENARNFGRFEALVKVGLLTSTTGKVQVVIQGAVPGKTYALTPAGEKALKSKEGLAFCAGHYTVADVVDYTTPGNEVGETISEVTYTYSPTGIPAWANSETVKTAFPYFTKRLDAPSQKARATLVLKNTGWSADLGMDDPYSTGY